MKYTSCTIFFQIWNLSKPSWKCVWHIIAEKQWSKISKWTKNPDLHYKHNLWLKYLCLVLRESWLAFRIIEKKLLLTAWQKIKVQAQKCGGFFLRVFCLFVGELLFVLIWGFVGFCFCLFGFLFGWLFFGFFNKGLDQCDFFICSSRVNKLINK